MPEQPCPCRKHRCPRHGDCEACRAHHAGRRYPPTCERGKDQAQKERGADQEEV